MGVDVSEVAKKLKELNANKPCHRCGGTEFNLMDEYSMIFLQSTTEGIQLSGGKAIPCALVICGRCGAVTPHALGILGLLSLTEGGKKDE